MSKPHHGHRRRSSAALKARTAIMHGIDHIALQVRADAEVELRATIERIITTAYTLLSEQPDSYFVEANRGACTGGDDSTPAQTVWMAMCAAAVCKVFGLRRSDAGALAHALREREQKPKQPRPS